MKKQIILNFLSKNKEYLRDKYGVTKIGLLGSYARNDEQELSDIDIVIEIEKNMKNIHNFLGLKRELEQTFGKPVDLGIESAIKPIVRETIQKDIIYV